MVWFRRCIVAILAFAGIASACLVVTDWEARRVIQTIEERGGNVYLDGYWPAQWFCRSVTIRASRFDSDDFKSLSIFGRLETLNLLEVPLDDSIGPELAKHTKLRTLSLYRTQVADTTVSHIATLQDLENLSLSFTAITNEGVASLINHPSIVFLELIGTRVSDECIGTLTNMPSLQRVLLVGTDVTVMGKKKLESLDIEVEIGEVPTKLRNYDGIDK